MRKNANVPFAVSSASPLDCPVTEISCIRRALEQPQSSLKLTPKYVGQPTETAEPTTRPGQHETE
jgi:hypothetical protein